MPHQVRFPSYIKEKVLRFFITTTLSSSQSKKAKNMGKLHDFFGRKQSKHREHRPLLCDIQIDKCVFAPSKGPPKSLRDAPPAHYILKIHSFSVLSKKYNSETFDAGGYKWKLSLYPKGNMNEKGGDYISLYLVMADSNSLPLGWEVKASFRFFLFDQIRGKYLMVEEEQGRLFTDIKKEWGFAQFVSLKTFSNSSKGYLINDNCVFGAEVFDVEERRTGKGECVSMIKGAVSCKQTLKIHKVSEIETECCLSNPFNSNDGFRWKIKFYREGHGKGKGNSLSLYLEWVNSVGLPPGCKVNADYCLRIIDQVQGINHSHVGNEWFSELSRSRGFPKFMPISEFNNPEKGFLVNDTCIVEAEVSIVGVTNVLT